MLSHFGQITLKIIFPVFAIGIGIIQALGIWLPRFRWRWKGSQTTCGPLSCAGGALCFIGVGVAFLAVDSVPERYRIWFAFPFMVGWILAALGYAIDTRANSSNSLQTVAPVPAPQAALRNERARWAFAAWGIFLLLIVLFNLFFLKR